MTKISSAIFKTFFLSLCIVANTHFAFGQTASILPPGYTQYLDNNGKPLSAGKVYNYIPSTTTPKTTWQDAAETIPNANPVILDAGGRAKILGDGSYRQIVKDRNNNTIWDAVTSSTGSGSTSPTATGDGDLVGTIKPWAGMTAPNQYAFTYGQEVSRTTYSTLYTAITSSQSVFCNSGSPTLNGLSDTTNFWVGMSVEVSCVAAGFSTIVSKTASTVVLAANANVTTNTTAVFYPWGRGNGTTTFNLPDLRGVVPAGNNNMGGVASANLTATYFGATDPNSAGALGGSQSKTLIAVEIPGHNHPVFLNDPGHVHGGIPTLTGTSAGIATTTATAPNTPTNTSSATTGITVRDTSGGLGTANQTNLTGGGIAVSATLGNTGSGYTNGSQTITISGGTCTTQPQFTVTVAGNIFTGTPVLLTAGSCTIAPTNPAATTGGGGTGGTLNVTYSAQPFSLIPPTRTTNFIIKITPDTNSATASGVTSLGGMTGDIACGANLTCTGNTISAVSVPSTGAVIPNSSCDGSSDDTAEIQAAVNSAGSNGTVQFKAKCTYKITSGITVPYNDHYWVGGGSGSTTINITPTATINAVSFTNGASSVDRTGISGIKFYCTENVQTKTVIYASDVRTFSLKNVAIGGAGSGVSGTAQCEGTTPAIGVHLFGREFISIDNTSAIAAEKPVIIDKNPNSFLDFDHSEITATLIADNNIVVNAAATIFMSNSVFSGSWNGGTTGFFFSNTVSSVTSYNLQFVDLRLEQGQSSSDYSINIDGGGSNSINGISFDNVYLDSARNGIRLRNATFASAKDTIYTGTTGIGLNITNSVGNLSLYNTFWNTGSTASIGAGLNRIYAGPTVPATGPLPGSAYYSTRSPDFNANVLSTGVAGTIQGQINLCGNTSGCASIRPQSVAGTAQIDIPLISGPITTNATAPLTINPVNGTVAMSGISALAQGDLIYGTSADTFARLTKDTNSTRYLSNTGTSNNPAWAQIDLSNGVTGILPIANGGSGTSDGPVVKVKNQIFTANGTYTPSTGMLYAIVEVAGGGGGGGGCTGTAGSIHSGGGGGSGGYSRTIFTASDIGASKVVVVGAGGAGGATGTNDGTAGAATCLTTSTCSSGQIIVGNGGSPGVAGSSGTNPLGGSGGTAGTGTLAAAGSNGFPGNKVLGALTPFYPSGFGGSSHYGGGARGTSNASAINGVNAGAYGSGGSGGSCYNTTSTGAGGNGSDGVINITEYTNQ